jgi:hypothetical protein
MVKETYTEGGQKVTTHYAKTGTRDTSGQNVQTPYARPDSRTKEEKLEAHAARRQQNRMRAGTDNSHDSMPYDEAPAYAKGEKRPKPAAPSTPSAPQQPRSVGNGGGIGNVFAGVGQRITHVTQSLPAPTWLTDVGSKPVKGRKGKVSSSPASNIPDWVMTGRMPWEQTQPAQKQVAKIITTRVNADGTRTTTTRVPKQNKGAKRPNWINW